MSQKPVSAVSGRSECEINNSSEKTEFTTAADVRHENEDNGEELSEEEDSDIIEDSVGDAAGMSSPSRREDVEEDRPPPGVMAAVPLVLREDRDAAAADDVDDTNNNSNEFDDGVSVVVPSCILMEGDYFPELSANVIAELRALDDDDDIIINKGINDDEEKEDDENRQRNSAKRDGAAENQNCVGSASKESLIDSQRDTKSSPSSSPSRFVSTTITLPLAAPAATATSALDIAVSPLGKATTCSDACRAGGVVVVPAPAPPPLASLATGATRRRVRWADEADHRKLLHHVSTFVIPSVTSSGSQIGNSSSSNDSVVGLSFSDWRSNSLSQRGRSDAHYPDSSSSSSAPSSTTAAVTAIPLLFRNQRNDDGSSYLASHWQIPTQSLPTNIMAKLLSSRRRRSPPPPSLRSSVEPQRTLCQVLFPSRLSVTEQRQLLNEGPTAIASSSSSTLPSVVSVGLVTVTKSAEGVVLDDAGFVRPPLWCFTAPLGKTRNKDEEEIGGQPWRAASDEEVQLQYELVVSERKKKCLCSTSTTTFSAAPSSQDDGDKETPAASAAAAVTYVVEGPLHIPW